MKFKETLVPVIGGNIVELSAWDKTRFQDIGDTFFALSWTLWANHYYIYVQLSALNDWATFPYWTECKKTWIRRTFFERIYSEISSNPINQSFRSKFIKATKNNVIRKIYILHFNRIRIDLDTNYLFKNLQRTSTSSNLPGDRGCCKHQIPPVSALWLGAVRCLVYSCSRDHGLWKNGMEKASERHRGTEVVRCRSDRKRI